MLELTSTVWTTKGVIRLLLQPFFASLEALPAGTGRILICLKFHVRKWPYYVLQPIFFGVKYDLIQLHKKIVHKNDGIFLRN